MYKERLRRNIRQVITEHGVKLHSRNRVLESIGARHLHNVEKGLAAITVDKLEEIADEIGADFLDFFRE